MIDVVVGVVFAGIGAGVISWSIWNLLEALASRRWATTGGVVVVSSLQQSRDSEGGFTYRSEVSYRYTVNGAEFVSSRARFGDGLSFSWSAPAVRTVRRYPTGAAVVVHYDPDEPDHAVLEPGVSGYIFGGLAFGVVFAALGVSAIVGGT